MDDMEVMPDDAMKVSREKCYPIVISYKDEILRLVIGTSL